MISIEQRIKLFSFEMVVLNFKWIGKDTMGVTLCITFSALTPASLFHCQTPKTNLFALFACQLCLGHAGIAYFFLFVSLYFYSAVLDGFDICFSSMPKRLARSFYHVCVVVVVDVCK